MSKEQINNRLNWEIKQAGSFFYAHNLVTGVDFAARTKDQLMSKINKYCNRYVYTAIKDLRET